MVLKHLVSVFQPGYLESKLTKFKIDKTSHNYSTPMDINFNDETENIADKIELIDYVIVQKFQHKPIL